MTQADSKVLTDDPVFIERLTQENLDQLIYRTRLALLLGSFVYPGFWFLDRLALPEKSLFFLGIRLTVLAAFIVCFVFLSQPAGRKYATVISVGGIYMAAFGIAVMTPYLGGFESNYYIGILMALVVAGLFFPWDVAPAIICGILVMISYFGINFAFFDRSTSLLSVAEPFFFLSGTFIFMVFAKADSQRQRHKDLIQRMTIEKANEDLKELDLAKTRFFSNVSHELRTPLMLILGPLESMLQGREPMTKSLLEAMDASARRLLRQVNALLDFAKIDANKLKCNPAFGNLGKVVGELAAASRPLAVRRNIDLNLIGLEDVPDSILDPEKVETIAANLISNAMKFTQEGGSITVRADFDDENVWFEVQDTGIGIPENQLESIFDRFLQVDDALSRRSEGTGLGLALVKELALLHRGKVSVESRLGVGSKFRVLLPREPDLTAFDRRKSPGRRRADQLAADRTTSLLGLHYESKTNVRTLLSDVEDAKLGSEGAPVSKAPPNAPRILLVEDNPDMRTFVARSLSGTYRIETAGDGIEALESVRRNFPDLIVSDIMMPRMDGFEFCRKLQEDPTLAQVPVILVTAKSGSEAVVEGLDIGAVDYVTKPFEMRELEARIAAHLRAKSLEKRLNERESRLTAIGEMTSSIVHDLKNPLNAIIGFADLARTDALASGQEMIVQSLNPVLKESKRLTNMITEVLDFARGRSADIHMTPTGIAEYLDVISEPMRRRLERVGILLHLDHDLPAGQVVNLDRDRIQRVIENLVKNAQEAISSEGRDPRGKNIWISTRLVPGSVVLRIADDGPGIPDQVASSLFEAFSTAGKKSGTGLGLAIARNLIKAHGGEISVEPKTEEGGAAFILTFPETADIIAPNHQEN